MPVSRHFQGKGEKVMAAMKRRYGKRAERVFYATETKQKAEHSDAMKRRYKKR